MTTVISVHSFRGGTGKSNTSSNLAGQLASAGNRVAITQGFLRASQRRVDEAESVEGAPVLSHKVSEPLVIGEPTRLRIPMHASLTLLRAGDELVVELHSSWMWPHNVATGQFPARYVTLPD